VIGFLAKRVVWILLTLWIVFTISFFLMRAVPGGPFDREKKIPDSVKARIEARYDLDKPLIRQYASNLWKTLKLDLGPSFKLEDYTVNEVIAQGFPVSASLGILALLFALVLGVSAGAVSALKRHTWLDVSVMTLATVGIALPNFVLASLAIVLFVFLIPIFPAGGWGTVGQLVLPAICLGAPFAAYIARLTRTGMLDVLGQDYIRTAYAKGLARRRIVIHHALRGALLPVISYLGPATAGILTGSLVLEQIFFLPGMGTHFIQAAISRDYTLAMGMVLVYTCLLLFMNTVVDISYALIDPRVKIE